ncbi:hypothetical protein DFJ43DRAFT_1151502 [Lentinula guzmanii]|uniref:Uncharacterized protein n=1 Tax=Lentinula guzmanii TaxID=2804957 RepID=A0AA38N2S5_9AGAR|nr:hypothetical protein DFJ43DRAFT_1151502 [Lentinula guzmanii]
MSKRIRSSSPSSQLDQEQEHQKVPKMSASYDNPSGDALRLFGENQQLHATIAALTSQVAVLEETATELHTQTLHNEIEEMSNYIEHLESSLDHRINANAPDSDLLGFELELKAVKEQAFLKQKMFEKQLSSLKTELHNSQIANRALARRILKISRCDASVQTDPNFQSAGKKEGLANNTLVAQLHSTVPEVMPIKKPQAELPVNQEYQLNLMAVFHSHSTDEAFPNWFEKGFEYVSDDFGQQYAELLHQYILFEASHHWVNATHGLKKTKPQQLINWTTQGKRKPAAALPIIAALSSIETIQKFAEALWTWWCELQPDWRIISRNRPEPFDKFVDNFLLLDKRGQNGWLGLIVCTKWWRLGLDSLDDNIRQELEADWFRVVEDMTNMLKGMVEMRNCRITAA